MLTKKRQEVVQCAVRRASLIKLIKEEYAGKEGALVLCAGFERDREPFFQDSSFLYFVGLEEPALVLYQPLDAQAVLYEPAYATDRSVWLPVKKDAALLTAAEIVEELPLGDAVPGYSTEPLVSELAVKFLTEKFVALVDAGQYLFVPLREVSFESLMFFKQVVELVPGLKNKLIDISPLIGQLRRKKEMRELEHMYKAIEITAAAQEGAAQMIAPQVTESTVQAAIEYIFAEGQSVRAFPCIVGSGINSTILHYVDNVAVMQKGDLVVIDIGASYNHYAADVTRTYPVSGTFSKRQKEIYQLVLDAQTYIAEAVKPGMYLRNAQFPEESLHHMAAAFFKDHGYGDYFPHGIGHFVGLDVHDVGDVQKPLQPGDVITIEPGLYIREEKLGVRIEDMYWIVQDGEVCLTEGIVKEVEQVEELMKQLKSGQ